MGFFSSWDKRSQTGSDDSSLYTYSGDSEYVCRFIDEGDEVCQSACSSGVNSMEELTSSMVTAAKVIFLTLGGIDNIESEVTKSKTRNSSVSKLSDNGIIKDVKYVTLDHSTHDMPSSSRRKSVNTRLNAKPKSILSTPAIELNESPYPLKPTTSKAPYPLKSTTSKNNSLQLSPYVLKKSKSMTKGLTKKTSGRISSTAKKLILEDPMYKNGELIYICKRNGGQTAKGKQKKTILQVNGSATVKNLLKNWK